MLFLFLGHPWRSILDNASLKNEILEEPQKKF
jgi:hypothetical protein